MTQTTTDQERASLVADIKERLEIRRKNGSFDTLEELVKQLLELPQLSPSDDVRGLIERLREPVTFLMPYSPYNLDVVRAADVVRRFMTERADAADALERLSTPPIPVLGEGYEATLLRRAEKILDKYLSPSVFYDHPKTAEYGKDWAPGLINFPRETYDKIVAEIVAFAFSYHVTKLAEGDAADAYHAVMERLQALGERYGCEPGENRLDWLERYLASVSDTAIKERV